MKTQQEKKANAKLPALMSPPFVSGPNRSQLRYELNSLTSERTTEDLTSGKIIKPQRIFESQYLPAHKHLRSSLPQSFNSSVPHKNEGYFMTYMRTDLKKIIKKESTGSSAFDRNSAFVRKAADNFIVSNKQLPHLISMDTPAVRLKYNEIEKLEKERDQKTRNKGVYRSLVVSDHLKKPVVEEQVMSGLDSIMSKRSKGHMMNKSTDASFLLMTGGVSTGQRSVRNQSPHRVQHQSIQELCDSKSPKNLNQTIQNRLQKNIQANKQWDNVTKKAGQAANSKWSKLNLTLKNRTLQSRKDVTASSKKSKREKSASKSKTKDTRGSFSPDEDNLFENPWGMLKNATVSAQSQSMSTESMGTNLTDSIFYQKFHQTLIKAMNDSADGKVISNAVMQELLGVNRRYVTPEIQIKLDNIIKRNNMLNGMVKFEKQCDNPILSNQDIRAKCILPEKYQTMKGSLAKERRIRTFDKMLDFMNGHILKEINDISFVDGSETAKSIKSKRSKHTTMSTPFDLMPPFDPVEMKAKNAEKQRMLKLERCQAGNLVQFGNQEAIEAANELVQKGRLHMQMRGSDNQIDHFVYGQTNQKWVGRDKTSHLKYVAQKASDGLIQAKLDEEEQYYFQNRMMVIKTAVKRLNKVELAQLFRMFGNMERVPPEQQGRVNELIEKLGLNKTSDEVGLMSPLDDSKTSTSNQPTLSPPKIKGAEVTQMSGLSAAAQAKIAKRAERERQLVIYLFEYLYKLTKMDDKIASLLQLLDETAELYDFEKFNRDHRIHMVQEFVLQQKTKMGASLKKFSHYVHMKEDSSEDSARRHKYKLDSIQAIFDDIVMDVPVKDYQNNIGRKNTLANLNHSYSISEQDESNKLSSARGGKNSPMYAGDYDDDKNSEESEEFIMGKQMYTYPKPSDTLGVILERLVGIAKTHGQKLDMGRNSVAQTKTRKLAIYRFFMESLQNCVTDKRIFEGRKHMILLDEGTVLDLSDFTLPLGACQSLARVFKSCAPRIRTLIFKRGPYGDLKQLLIGAKRLRVKEMFLSELDLSNCGDALRSLKLKRPPHNLQQLTLDKCHISPTALDDLLNCSAMGHDRIHTLKLIRMELGDFKFYNVLTKYLENKKLESLSIIKCRVLPEPYLNYVEKLLKNRFYTSLALSFNLIDPGPQFAEQVRDYIKYNHKLMTIDVSGCGLTKEDISTIMSGVRSSMTLQTVDFSHNKAAKDSKAELYKLMTEHLKSVKPLEDRIVIEQPADIKRAIDSAEVMHLRQQQRLINIYTDEVEFHNKFICNKFLIERKLGYRKDIPGSDQWELKLEEKNYRPTSYILDRHIYTYVFYSRLIHNELVNTEENQYVSHYAEKLIDKWKSKRVGETNTTPRQNKLGFQLLETPNSKRQNLMFNQTPNMVIHPDNSFENPASVSDQDSYSIFSESELGTPKVYCSANNWKGQEMIPLMEFLRKYILKGEFLDEAGLLEKLKIQGRIYKDTRMRDLDSHGRTLLHDEYNKYLNHIRMNFEQSFLEHSKYERPFTVNIEGARRSVNFNDDIWVCPLFLSPGKHSILFSQERGDIDADVTLQTCIAPMRKEPAKFHIKAYKQKELSDKAPPFRKNGSVFVNWRDTNGFLESNDFKKWKLERFVKEEETQNLIKDFFKNHVNQVKEMYMNLNGESVSYPGISQLAFRDFCIDTGLIDKQLTSSAVDTLFIAGNFNVQQKQAGDNAKNELIRYEFLEVLVRIVKKKYIETGVCLNYASGLELLFKTVKESASMMSYKDWRERELWTGECNSVLNLNLGLIQSVYDLLAKGNESKKVELSDVMEVFYKTEHDDLRLTARQVRLCFCMSHMPVIAEEFDMERYVQIQFVEFLEFIARIAVIKLDEDNSVQDSSDDDPTYETEKGTPTQEDVVEEKLSLARKIELMLDRILQILLQEERVEPEEDEDPDQTLESASESEDA